MIQQTSETRLIIQFHLQKLYIVLVSCTPSCSRPQDDTIPDRCRKNDLCGLHAVVVDSFSGRSNDDTATTVSFQRVMGHANVNAKTGESGGSNRKQNRSRLAAVEGRWGIHVGLFVWVRDPERRREGGWTTEKVVAESSRVDAGQTEQL